MDMVKNFACKLTKDFKEKGVNLDPYLFSKSKSNHVEITMPKNTWCTEKGNYVDYDLYKHIRFIFVLGRFLGIIPYSGVFKKPMSYKNLHFRFKNTAAILSVLVLVLITINLIFGILFTIKMRPNKNAYEISKSVGTSIQFIWAWLIYFNFIYRRTKLLDLFTHWRDTTVYFQAQDVHLKRDVILITSFIMISAILENGVLHLEFISAFDSISGSEFVINTSNNMSILETYYRRSHYHWANFVGYDKFIAVIAFLQHKCMLYSWNYMDIMIAAFARAMHFKFKILYQLSREMLVKPMRNEQEKYHKNPNQACNHTNVWEQIAYDHKQLCYLLDKMKGYFSPLIFGSYAVNIFYICIQLLDGLTSDMTASSLIHSIYAPWSILHIIMRLYILSICAARVNVYAHKIQEVIQECPSDQYRDEISRLDKKVTCGPQLGFSGLDCFVVTKPFLLQIISVVFTFELVLLQGAPS